MIDELILAGIMIYGLILYLFMPDFLEDDPGP